MKITFLYSRETLQESVSVLSDIIANLDDTTRRNLKISIPKTQTVSTDDFSALRDTLDFDPVQKLYQELDLQTNVLDALKKHTQYKNISLQDEYLCCITHFGPAGFYGMPNTIFLNINQATCGSFLETALHELLHIIFYADTINLDYEQTERFIDDKFVLLWGQNFPDYHVQFKSK